MIAYVAGSVVVLPLLSLTGISEFLNMLTVSPWLGFIKGVIFTSLRSSLVRFFEKRIILADVTSEQRRIFSNVGNYSAIVRIYFYP